MWEGKLLFQFTDQFTQITDITRLSSIVLLIKGELVNTTEIITEHFYFDIYFQDLQTDEFTLS